MNSFRQPTILKFWFVSFNLRYQETRDQRPKERVLFKSPISNPIVKIDILTY